MLRISGQYHYLILLVIVHHFFGCFAQQSSIPARSPNAVVLPPIGTGKLGLPFVTAPPFSLSSSPPSSSLLSSPLSSPSSLTSTTPSTKPSSSVTESSRLLTSTASSPASETNPTITNPSSSSQYTHILLCIVFGALGLLFIGLAAWLYHRKKKQPKSEALTVTVTRPLFDPDNDMKYDGLSEDFDPWSGLPESVDQQQQASYPQQQIRNGQEGPHSLSHAPITLSTITEESIQGRTNVNKLPSGSPPAYYSFIGLGYYSPPLGRSGSVDQLSYAGDSPISTAAADPHQYPPAAPTPLRGSITAVGDNEQPGNLISQNVSRDGNEPEDLEPPTYSVH